MQLKNPKHFSKVNIMYICSADKPLINAVFKLNVLQLKGSCQNN